MKLLLWDIDGTLVCTGAAGERALVRALKDVCGVTGSLNVIDYRGRTDAFIARQLFTHYGVDPTPENLHNYLEAYLLHLNDEMPLGVTKTHPGILEVLELARARKDIKQGLLTGNMSRGARIKLDHFKVWNFFEFGAFADDSHIRDELGPFALRRAKETTGLEFEPKNVFIIGDTPHDIQCGKVIGASTIAVATGGFSVEELQKHTPTAVLQDLSDAKKFFEVIDSV